MLLFCALLFLSLSLSAFFLISALLSDDEKKNHRARLFAFFFSSSLVLLLVLSLLCWGSFTQDDTTGAGCVCGRFALFLAYFLFVVAFFFGQSSVCALFCCSFYCHGRTIYLHNAFPLYPMRGKHIKVFIIIHNI